MDKRNQHPGKVLAQELAAIGVTPAELARQLSVPANRISQILNGKRAITGDTALRLAHWFGSSPEYWMAIQSEYDVQEATRQSGAQISRLPTKSDFISTTRSGAGA